jgi:hypothetical protein
MKLLTPPIRNTKPIPSGLPPPPSTLSALATIISATLLATDLASIRTGPPPFSSNPISGSAPPYAAVERAAAALVAVGTSTTPPTPAPACPAPGCTPDTPASKKANMMDDNPVTRNCGITMATLWIPLDGRQHR